MKLPLVLLVLTATVVAGHPYSDSRDGVTKNTQLTDEDIAAYLRSKMIKEELELAKIVEYVESLIQGQKNRNECKNLLDLIVAKVQDSDCSTGRSISKSQLKDILDTVIGNVSNNLTLLTPDHFVTMYPNEGDTLLRSYELMLLDPTSVTNIWTNYAPTPVCVHSLITHYSGVSSKPKIHIARLLHVDEDQNQVILTLQCLAKLVSKGFNIEAWNMQEFNNTQNFTEGCTTLIFNYSNDDNFNAALEKLRSHINFIDQLGQKFNDSWCE